MKVPKFIVKIKRSYQRRKVAKAKKQTNKGEISIQNEDVFPEDDRNKKIVDEKNGVNNHACDDRIH